MRDKQIMIDGVKYNPCNDCELWDGHHCIGARSYEPNANEHKAICNEHMAKQFYKVYQQLYRKTQECESLKEEIEVLKDNFDTATRDCNELIEELKQECEELKKKFSKFFNIDNQECWDIAFLKDENARYKQALDEIEENCLKAQDPCQEDWDRKTENFAKPILDIINKAKGR